MDDVFGAQSPLGPQDDSICPIEIDFSEISDLCHLMPRRQLVTGILVKWMRLHFTYPSNIEHLLLQDKLWSNNNATNIFIDSVFKWQPAVTDGRPAILVKPGPWKVLRYGLDDRKMMGVNNTECHRKYITFFQGSHTLFCIAGESAEVELLAAEVSRELVEFGPAARSVFNFLRFVVSDIGEVSILNEAKEHFVVPVVVSYGTQDVWSVCPPGLKELNELGPNFPFRPE